MRSNRNVWPQLKDCGRTWCDSRRQRRINRSSARSSRRHRRCVFRGTGRRKGARQHAFQRRTRSMSARFARNLAAAGTRSLPARACAERWRKSKKKFWRKLVKSLSAPATPDGVLLVDKAAGMTSHDVVALARRQLGTKKSAIAARSIRSPPACFCSLSAAAQRFRICS